MRERHQRCPARDNPFAVHRVLRVRYAFEARDWEALFARLRAAGGRGALVGPHGSGKTTLIEDLAVRLEAQRLHVHWIRLNREDRAIPAAFHGQVRPRLSGADAVLVDGAEQLSALAWWRLRVAVRRAGVFVITTHRSGRLPTIWTCVTCPELLSAVVGQLGVTLEAGPAAALLQRHRGNIREALRELYDRCDGLRADPPAAQTLPPEPGCSSRGPERLPRARGRELPTCAEPVA